MIRQSVRHPVATILAYYVLLGAVVWVLLQLVPAVQAGFSLERLRSLEGLDQLSRALAENNGQFNPSAPPGPGMLALHTVIGLLGALALSWPIALVYMITKPEMDYDESVVHTVIILPLAVSGVVLIVSNNIALAFSLAGIVGAVRFRNTLKDPKDAVYMFIAIGIGLATGVQAGIVAYVMSLIFNLAIIALWKLNVGDLYAFRQETAPALAGPPAATAAAPAHAAELAPAPTDRTRGSMVLDMASLLPEMRAAEALEPVINPELSVLEFNARVLALAEDPYMPLLARLRFLSIFTTNLDEFFMVKVGGLKQALAAGITKRSIDGRTPRELQHALGVRLRALLRRQYRCFNDLREHELPSHGIRIRRWEDLNESEREYLHRFFDEQVFPMLTPKAITSAPGHPFPQIGDLQLSLAVIFRDPRTNREHLVHLNVTDALPRFIRLGDTDDFVILEDVIRAYVGALYPGREVDGVYPFRLTRSGDIQFDEEAAPNFLEVVEEEVRRRPFGAIVRVEVEQSMPENVRDLLLSELRREVNREGIPLEPPDLYETDGPIDLGGLVELASLPLPDLDFPVFAPTVPLDPQRSIFDVLDQHDVLVHHPYESFDETTQRLLVEAADDPDVVMIKMTLYRTGGRSLVAEALRRAAAAGKDVSVFVEIKARFDEELNIFWAKQLERAGIHVVTGLVSLKTHAKVALVVRRQGDKLRRYGHIGTGNYNASTAKFYTDFGLLTTDDDLTADLNTLFNELTGSSRAPAGTYRKLLVAPTYMLRQFLDLIEREAAHARAGRGGHIRAKLNGLADTEVIEALYKASQAGVRIELVVRGICSLRPGVRGLSENIRVVSILGRFLEHGRIYYFGNAGEPEYFIGSADWRSRNLRRRVEAVVPVEDPGHRTRLESVLEAELGDPAAWDLKPDGSYERVGGTGTFVGRSAQDFFMTTAATASASS